MVKNPIINIDKIEKDLKPTKREALQTVLLAGAETIIPFSGGVARLLDASLDSSTKRGKESVILIGRGLLELENRFETFFVEDLIEDENFKAILIRTIQLTLQTSKEEKLKYLRNAVLNSALPNDLNDDMQIMFLSYIDSFTTLHIKLLNFVNQEKSEELIKDLSKNVNHQDSLHDSNGGRVNEKYVGTTYTVREFEFRKVLEYKFPDYIKHNFLYEQVMKDLASKDMMINLQPTTTFTLSSNEKFNTRLPVFGKMFIEFITSPLDHEL